MRVFLKKFFKNPYRLWLGLGLNLLLLGTGALWGGGEEGSSPFLSALLSASLIFWAFIAGYFLLHGFLSTEGCMRAVARVVVAEGLRTRGVLVFLVLLFLIIVFLPFSIEASAPLKYRIQTFLSFGLGATSVLLSLLTLFLACGSLAGELEDRRIFGLLTKPLSRPQYLLGKLLGIASLNILLLCVAGLAFWVSVRQMASGVALNEQDRRAVDEEVLASRQAWTPIPDFDLSKAIEERMERWRKNEQGFYGQTPAPLLRKKALDEIMTQWHGIGPGQKRNFIFDGLDRQNLLTGHPHLRWKAMMHPPPPKGKLSFKISINGESFPMTARAGIFESFPLPERVIGPAGRVVLTIENRDGEGRLGPSSLVFDHPDGILLFFRTGSFEANLARTLLILWLKILFLAALGLAAASFLCFQVAVLATGAFLTMAMMSGFVLEALEKSGAHGQEDVWGAFSSGLQMAMRPLVQLMQQYDRFSPMALLVDGRLISWGYALEALFWLGLLWTGGAVLAALWIFRRRELARVQV